MGASPCRGQYKCPSSPYKALTPVQFHFASVLSPWIRRALVAGGFGISTHAGVPTEIAPVVPYRGGGRDRSTWPDDSSRSKIDVEAHESSDPRDGTYSHDTGPILATDTPFFHFDLTSAVRAAEATLVRSAPMAGDTREGFGPITWSDGTICDIRSTYTMLKIYLP
jgi:hypothetical protein